MNGLPETIADFIGLRRANAEVLEKAAGGMPNQFQRWLIADLRDEADRLEAAWKREKATIETSAAVGNTAKLREVVELLARAILPPQEEYPAEYGGGKVPDEDGWLAWIRQMQVRACDALATPPRNCDVGTSDEQTRRLRANCKKYKPTCKGCEFLTDIRHENCWLKWAQMPYGEN